MRGGPRSERCILILPRAGRSAKCNPPRYNGGGPPDGSEGTAVEEEAAFLLQLDSQPDDLDTPLVYADWLDDRGDAGRAEFLRLNRTLLGMRFRQKGFSEASKRLLRL